MGVSGKHWLPRRLTGRKTANPCQRNRPPEFAVSRTGPCGPYLFAKCTGSHRACAASASSLLQHESQSTHSAGKRSPPASLAAATIPLPHYRQGATKIYMTVRSGLCGRSYAFLCIASLISLWPIYRVTYRFGQQTSTNWIFKPQHLVGTPCGARICRI